MSHCAECPFGEGVSECYPDGDRSQDQQSVLSTIGDFHTWCCHDKPDTVCAGFIRYCSKNGIDFKSRTLITEHYTPDQIEDLKSRN